MRVSFTDLKEWVDTHEKQLTAIMDEYPSMTPEEVLKGILDQGLRFEMDVIDMLDRLKEGQR